MGSAPKAPDPVRTAQAQGSANRDTAITEQLLGMVNQVTPGGNLTYSQTGTRQYTGSDGKTYTLPTYTATQTLSPVAQRAQEAQQQAGLNVSNLARDQSARIAELLGQNFSLSGAPRVTAPNLAGAPKVSAPKLGTLGNQDYEKARSTVENAIIQREAGNQARDLEAVRTRLINQGVRPGTAAYDAEMANYNRGVNDFRLGAQVQAGQEQSRLFGMDADRLGINNQSAQQQFANQLGIRQNYLSEQQQQFANQQGQRQNYISERLLERNQPLNEIGTLLSGGQIQGPQFVNTPGPQVGGTDVAGPINAAYQAQVGSRNSMLGGLFGLAGAGITGGLGLLSDRRAKTDVQKVGKLNNGLGVYSYRYKSGGPAMIGVMAQDVAKKNPDAVGRDPASGMMTVDYEKAVAYG